MYHIKLLQQKGQYVQAINKENPDTVTAETASFKSTRRCAKGCNHNKQISSLEEHRILQTFFIQHFSEVFAEKCTDKRGHNSKQCHSICTFSHQFDDNPRSEHKLDSLLTAIGNQRQIIRHVLLSHDELALCLCLNLRPWHNFLHVNQQSGCNQRQNCCNDKRFQNLILKTEESPTIACKNNKSRHHRTHICFAFEIPQRLADFTFSGQIHTDGIVERHKQVHTQRLDKQKNHHHAIGRTKRPHHHQTNHHQHLGNSRNADIAESCQC